MDFLYIESYTKKRESYIMPSSVNSNGNNNVTGSMYKSNTPKFQGAFGTDDPKKNESIFSKFDTNKNSKIELNDVAAKSHMANQQKEVKAQNFSKDVVEQVKFDAKAEYNKILQKAFKSFDYDSKAPATIDTDRIVEDNLNSQSESINNQLQKMYTQQLEKQKKEMLNARNDKDYPKLKSDFETAKSEFQAHLKQDGVFADIADGVSKTWNNKVVNLTGNTADMVRDDLSKYANSLNKFLRSGDPKEREQIKAELKSMDIVNRVRKYNDSQEKGAVAVEVTAGVAATTAFGPAGGALVVGTAKMADEVSKDIKQDKMDLTTKEGWKNLGKDAALGVKDGAITYVGGKIVGAGMKYGGAKLANTGFGKAINNGTTKFVASGIAARATVQVSKFAAKKAAGKGVGKGLGWSTDQMYTNTKNGLAYMQDKTSPNG